MDGQWLHRYLQPEFCKDIVSRELIGRGYRGCLVMYWQWLHRYLQQFSEEIVSREILGRG
jgi:hypothetical protein